jgi:hypothetical protein
MTSFAFLKTSERTLRPLQALSLAANHDDEKTYVRYLP